MQVNDRSGNDERRAAVFTAAHSSSQILGLDGLAGLHADAGGDLAECLAGRRLQRDPLTRPVRDLCRLQDRSDMGLGSAPYHGIRPVGCDRRDPQLMHGQDV